jgi:protein phosphatase inhibitor 2
MRLVQLQWPLQAAVKAASRPTVTTLAGQLASLRINGIDGRRYASVKSQGHYKLKSKKTLPKKLGAKRTGGMC